MYDNEDSVCGIIYNGTTYYFQKNLQGDIIAIVDASGKLQAKYTYDAWGKCTEKAFDENGEEISTYKHIASINPFRYRGYYFDSETGFYYLQSRYYDPSTGRFINGDEQISFDILDLNLFAYCKNNTTNSIDIYGHYRIMIDPGHGGADDKGAIGYRIYMRFIYGALFRGMYYVKEAYYEKDFNLNVAKEVSRWLRWDDYTVYMTRTTDVAKSTTERHEYANNRKVDYFVSIHHNSSNVFKRGYRVLYAGKHDTKLSKKLADSISRAFAQRTALRKYANPSADTSLAVLNGTKMPAVLVECGYMGGDLIYCRDYYKKLLMQYMKELQIFCLESVKLCFFDNLNRRIL